MIFNLFKFKRRPLIGINIDRNDKETPTYGINVAYILSVVNAGGIPILIPPTSSSILLDSYIKMCDGFVFTGGLSYPTDLYGGIADPEMNCMSQVRVQSDMYLAKQLLLGIPRIKYNKPILGICAGMQLVNIALGGKLRTDFKTHKDTIHAFLTTDHMYTKNRIFQNIIDQAPIGCYDVNSFHKQGIDPLYMGRGLEIAAISLHLDRNEKCIEVAEGTGEQYILLTQFHPEKDFSNKLYQAIFRDFINHC